MSVAPLTAAEQDTLPRSPGALYPKGVFLRCQCGQTGTVASVSAHRSKADRGKNPTICTKQPDVFRTLDDAQIYEAEVGARQRLEQREEDDRVRREYLAQNPEAPVVNPDPPRPARGRGRNDDVRGDGRQGGTERVDVPREATVRLTVEVPADVFNRYNECRLNPDYGFVGDCGEYLAHIERSFWVIDAWLREGQPCPLGEFAVAA